MSTYEVTKITSQDELIIATNEEKPVIEITGNIFDSIISASNELSKSAKNSIMGVSILSASYAATIALEVINPLIGVPLVIYGMKKSIGSGIHNIKSSKKLVRHVGKKVTKYCLYFHPSASKIDDPVFLLIAKSFDLKYDTIAERPTCCFYDKKCSHCGNKIKDYDRKYKAEVLPALCEKCQKPIFYKLA